MAARGGILVNQDEVVRRFFTSYSTAELGRVAEPIPSLQQPHTTLPVVALSEALAATITDVCRYFNIQTPSLAPYNTFREPDNHHAVTDELLERIHHFILPSLEVGPMQWGTGPPPACFPNLDQYGPWPQTDLPPVRPPYHPIDIFKLYSDYLWKAKDSYEKRLVQLPSGAPQTLVLLPPPTHIDERWRSHQIFQGYLSRQTTVPNTPPGHSGPPAHQNTPLPNAAQPTHPSMTNPPSQNTPQTHVPSPPQGLPGTPMPPPGVPHLPHMGMPPAPTMPSPHGQPATLNPPPTAPGHPPPPNAGIPPPPPGGFQIPAYMPSPNTGLNALLPTQPPGRRIDVAPKTEEDKLVHGKADIGAAALNALAQNDSRQVAWQSRVSTAKGMIAPNIPMRALQHQLCDRTTRLGVRPALSLENVTALTADMSARERQVLLALTRAFHGNEPHDTIVRRFQATALPIRCTLMPNLATSGETKTTTDLLGRKRTTESLNLLDSANLIRATLMAAWPEFDWLPLVELIELFRSLMGWAEKAADTDPTSAKARGLERLATDTLHQGLQLIENNADVFRFDDADTMTPSRDICQAATFRQWLYEKEAKIHEMVNMAAVFAPPRPTTPAPPPRTPPRPSPRGLRASMRHSRPGTPPSPMSASSPTATPGVATTNSARSKHRTTRISTQTNSLNSNASTTSARRHRVPNRRSPPQPCPAPPTLLPTPRSSHPRVLAHDRLTRRPQAVSGRLHRPRCHLPRPRCPLRTRLNPRQTWPHQSLHCHLTSPALPRTTLTRRGDRDTCPAHRSRPPRRPPAPSPPHPWTPKLRPLSDPVALSPGAQPRTRRPRALKPRSRNGPKAEPWTEPTRTSLRAPPSTTRDEDWAPPTTKSAA